MSQKPPWIKYRNRRRLIVAICSIALVIVAVVGVVLSQRFYGTASTTQVTTAPTSGEPQADATFEASAPPMSELPNSDLTPGAVATTDTEKVCTPGYATDIRPRGSQWLRLKEQAYRRYGIPRGHRSYIDSAGHRHPAYEIDHLIPLEIGGAPEDLRNLWPQTIVEAKAKDKVENALHALVCSGQMPIAAAQAAVAKNWETAVPAR